MIAADFQSVGNSAAQKTIKINEFIKGDFVGDTVNDNCPIIQIWDAGNSIYADWRFYSESTGKSDKKYNFWGLDRTKENYDTYMAATVNLGQAVWFQPKADCTIQVAGQVAEVSSTTVDVKPGEWNMIANPWPIALKINTGIDWAAQVEAGNIVGDTVNDNCPIIQIWDAENSIYADWRFYSESTGKSDKKYNFWGLDRTKENYDTYMAATVPVGYGFWFKYGQHQSDKPMTLTFTK